MSSASLLSAGLGGRFADVAYDPVNLNDVDITATIVLALPFECSMTQPSTTLDELSPLRPRSACFSSPDALAPPASVKNRRSLMTRGVAVPSVVNLSRTARRRTVQRKHML